MGFFKKQANKAICSVCNTSLEEAGEIPLISYSKMAYITSGLSHLIPIVDSDPFAYRGSYCSFCKEMFCKSCNGDIGSICSKCNKKTLTLAYRPYLSKRP